MIRSTTFYWSGLLALVLLLRQLPLSAQYGAYEMFHHWDFREASDTADWGRAEVPGNLHLDLLRLGRIPHPFSGTVEDSLQWIGERDWSYRSHLHVSDTLLASGHPEMVFEGLDTYADIYLNGVFVKHTNNMFRRWVIPVEGLLQPGHNSVEVVFRATGPREAALQARSGYAFPGGSRVFTRKAQYHYGWDWGPRYITAGIWKNAALQTWNRARILDVHYRLDSLVAGASGLLPRRVVTPAGGWAQDPFDPELAWVTVQVELEADGEHELLLRLGEELPGQEWSVTTRAGKQLLEYSFVVTQPKLWWSRGLGESFQYRARLWLEDPATGLPLDQDWQNVGLRIVELVREPDVAGRVNETGVSIGGARVNETGANSSATLQDQFASKGPESFYFRLNGVPVYARGANWIPTSSFVFGYVPDYQRLLRDAERSNINMLRVWGGGIYELDVFYDWCSRNGILIWQDFMFACAMYPGAATGLPEFTENVRFEATEQIKRLRRYPAMALWCGNNENAEGWARWGWQEQFNKEQRAALEQDYAALFEELLPRLVGQFHPELDYWPSSPRWGRGDKRYLSEGDAHDWWVWHDGKPFASMETAIPRFMSEFGFQAYPDVQTLAKWAGSLPERFDTADAFLEAHQKHPRGAAVVDRFMRAEFGRRLPETFSEYVYLSQWLQADGMGKGLEAQRRARPYCMGSLYWQYNDVWPSVSWSGMDVEGRWKALQYRVRRSFSDLMVSSHRDSSGVLHCVAVNDRRESAGVVWELSVYSAAGERLHHLAAFTDVPGGESVELWSGSADDWPGLKHKDIVVHAELREMGSLASEHFWYPGRAGDWPHSRPSLQWRVEAGPGGAAQVRLSADRPVRGIWLQSGEPGWFSDNGFDLLPNRETVVVFEPAGGGLPGSVPPPPADLKAFEEGLKVLELGGVLGR